MKAPHQLTPRICPNFSCADTKSPDTCAANSDNSPAITVEATSCDSNTEFIGCLFYPSQPLTTPTFISSMHAC